MAGFRASGAKRVKPTVQAKADELDQLLANVKTLESEILFLRKMSRCPLQVDFEGDVEFILDKFGYERVQAHQFVLVNKSKVFEKMFEHGMEESRTRKIKISDTSAPVLRAFLSFLYRGEIKFGPNVGAADVYHLAIKYDIPDLVQECECKIIKSLSDRNHTEVFELAQLYNSRSLGIAAHRQSSKSLFNAALKYVVAYDLHAVLYPQCSTVIPNSDPLLPVPVAFLDCETLFHLAVGAKHVLEHGHD